MTTSEFQRKLAMARLQMGNTASPSLPLGSAAKRVRGEDVHEPVEGRGTSVPLPSSLLATPANGVRPPSSRDTGSAVSVVPSSAPGSSTDGASLDGNSLPVLALHLDESGGRPPDAEHQKIFIHICNAKRPKKVKAALILEAISEEEAQNEDPDSCLHNAAIISRVLLKRAPLPEGAVAKLANLFNYSVASTDSASGAAASAACAPSDDSSPVVSGDQTAAA